MIFSNHNFVDIDVILRQGGHINRSDIVLYQFLCANYEELRSFYERYQCSLVQHPDGFFFLLSQGSILPSRLMPKTCMHLGMFIALKMRDPEITRSSGKMTVKQLLQSIETSVPRETLQRIYAPKQREASQYERITEEIMRALRILEDLRFLVIKDSVIRPTEAINRFAELARHDNEPDPAAQEALLIQRGVMFESPDDTDTTDEMEKENESTN
jgi:chromosome partition protein MukE